MRSILSGMHDQDLQDEREDDRSENADHELEKLEQRYLTLVPSQTTEEPEPVITREPKKQDAFIGKLLAIEVLCPNCGGSCTDPKTGSLMITEDLIGHSVTCVECHTRSLVPLNAFTRRKRDSTRETHDKRSSQQSREKGTHPKRAQKQRRT